MTPIWEGKNWVHVSSGPVMVSARKGASLKGSRPWSRACWRMPGVASRWRDWMQVVAPLVFSDLGSRV